MPNSQNAPPTDSENIRTLYEEICRAHDGIADFRAKLLALLPIASGAGVFLLLKMPESSLVSRHGLAIGAFGALVTFGLFLYELRGIQRCNVLTHCGKNVEEKLLSSSACLATFTDEPEAVFKFVGNTGAAFIIYPSVIAAWVYVATQQLYQATLFPLLFALGTLVLFNIFGLLVINKQRQLMQEFAKTRCPTNIMDSG